MEKSNVSEICVYEIRLSLQIDEISDTVNTLHFIAIRAGIQMRGAGKNIHKGALI
jgi:hypothetical protein